MTDADTQAVYQLVQNGQGLVEAQKLAAKYTEKALQGIKKLPETQDESKDYLYRITEQILTRTN